MVAAGADIDTQDYQDESPLHWAEDYKKPDMVKYLVLQGADVNLTNKNGKKPGEMTDDDDFRIAFPTPRRRSLFEPLAFDDECKDD